MSFKVYMTAEDDECKEEIRRFGIEADVITHYAYLRNKIETIFPTLRGRHFSISWKDSDNDDVLISSNEELQIALNETASHDIRKLYVTLRSEHRSVENAAPLAANEGGEIHGGVVCDVCEEQIKGFRYKCIQCDDYDLCFECESKGMHPEHCLIRFATPLHITPSDGARLADVTNKFMRNVRSQSEMMPKPRRSPTRTHCLQTQRKIQQKRLQPRATRCGLLRNVPGRTKARLC